MTAERLEPSLKVDAIDVESNKTNENLAVLRSVPDLVE